MSEESLKAEKYPQGDLFVCDITDVILKDDMASMEHPFYSLTKKPDRTAKRYEHRGNWIEFRPSIKGLPTIYDKDLIIYAVSQLIAGMNSGRPISKTVEFDPYHYLVFTERTTGGRDYDALVDSIDRLDGTRFRTNVVLDGKMSDKWMGIIDSAALQTNAKTGKPEKLRITLSDMMMEAVTEMKVLTLNKAYFRIPRPIERRIYEIARKQCGTDKTSSPILLTTLQMKCGSRSAIREFRRVVRDICQKDRLPDYSVQFIDEEDKVIFHRRDSMPVPKKVSATVGPLKPDTMEKARAVAPGWDIYNLENRWRGWIKEPPKNPDAAFIGFCKKFYEREGAP